MCHVIIRMHTHTHTDALQDNPLTTHTNWFPKKSCNKVSSHSRRNGSSERKELDLKLLGKSMTKPGPESRNMSQALRTFSMAAPNLILLSSSTNPCFFFFLWTKNSSLLIRETIRYVHLLLAYYFPDSKAISPS